MWKQVVFGGVVLASTAATSLLQLSKNGDEHALAVQTEVIDVKDHNNSNLYSAKNGLEKAILASRGLVTHFKEVSGAPGIVIGVSVNGNQVWQEGFGYADLEQAVPCTQETVMRIASVSKCITMTAVAKYWETGQLDMDRPVHEYIPGFPSKTHKNGKTSITSRHLAAHQSGIRHYQKDATLEKSNEVPPEVLSIKKYNSTAESLELFKNDPLLFEPGTNFLYTTYGWTLLSAVVEEISKTPFARLAQEHFKRWGMTRTYLDSNEAIILHRSKFYVRNKDGMLENAPPVDNSYKWAGGGFLSTVGDLTHFGNIMLYGHQFVEERCRSCPAGYLKRETVESLWRTTSPDDVLQKKNFSYGLGWAIAQQHDQYGGCAEQRRFVFHSGSAVGSSSTLVLLLPRNEQETLSETCQQKGTVVAIMANIGQLRLSSLAVQVATIFEQQE